jgi:hypothetical protein
MSGCRADPSELADGEYPLMTSYLLPHDWPHLDSPPKARAVVEGDLLTIADERGTHTSYRLGEEGDSYQLCPHAQGPVILLDPQVTLAGVELVNPAAIGACDSSVGDLSIVDVTSYDSRKAAFTRWLYFCRVNTVCQGGLLLYYPPPDEGFMPSPHIPPDS